MKWLSLFLILCGLTVQGAQYNFVVEPKELYAGEEATIRLICLGEGSVGKLPEIKDWQWLGVDKNQIDQLEKTGFEQPSYTYFKELFPPYLSAGLLLLALGFFLQNTLLQRIP